MPLLMPCEELQPGMRLCEAVISEGRVMLQGGKVLSEGEINALCRRYPGLIVRVGDPVLDEALEFEDDSQDRQLAFDARQRVSDSLSRVQERFSGRSSVGGADFDTLTASVKELMTFLKGNPASAALLSSCLDSDTYLATHTGNVFYLSMLLGSAALDYVAAERRRQTSAKDLDPGLAMDLTPLGLAAVAMDLGLLPLRGLYEEEQPLTEEQHQGVHEHPTVGADMLPANFSSVARMVVRTHHENVEGTGYPQGLPGDKVHVFSRIIRIADAYDTATSDHIFKQARSSARVLWEITVGPARRFFDPMLTRAFARLIQPFPVGGRLELEDGRGAVVVRYNRKKPYQPVVAIAFDDKGQAIPRNELAEPIDLSAEPGLRIRSFRGEDLSFLYRTDAEPDAPPRATFASLYESAFP